MKKIFWGIQQLSKLGGTEVVTINLINRLADYYEITLLCSSTKSEEEVYQIDKRVKIIYQNVPLQLVRFDESFKKYFNDNKFFSAFRLVAKLIHNFVFKAVKIRKKNHQLMGKEDVYIGSSLDSYIYAPKNRTVYFHFHFDGNGFCSFANKCMLMLARKPDKYIFLTKSALDYVVSKNKKLKEKSTYIFNPNRFEPVLDMNNYNNTILFAGRFAPQKDPLLALAILKKLKDKSVKFQANFFGEGSLKKDMEKYIDEFGLRDCAFLNSPTKKIEKEIAKSDILLLPSILEGAPLIALEANSFSKPVISSNWGQAAEELIVDGENGYVIDSRDPELFAIKIANLFSSPSKLSLLKQKTYEHSLKNSNDSIITKWRELLK